MKFKSALGDGIFLHSLTPKEPLLQTMRHHVYASWTVPTVVAKLLLYSEAIQVCGAKLVSCSSAFWSNRSTGKGKTLLQLITEPPSK